MTQKPFSMTNEVIKESINKWGDISRDGAALVSYFEQGNSFFFDINRYEEEILEDIHAYPGIYDGRLIFMLIPSQYDKEEYAADIWKYVTPSPVIWSLGGGRIPEGIAKDRIERWNKNYKIWTPKQAATTDGMFLAFKIDAEDFELPDSQVNFALRKDTTDPLALSIIDLVITNKDESKVFYDDFVTPVPPYNASAVPESFFLLSL
ncbi:hypothetical protein DVK85_01235 [Flavobacterium arcticum]|uniref:Uncharacterized protein n=1 Tax=Flavobacterium arcticum TaxID=1784713 RepID=A0A345H8L6_9FLAO|nr:hypothetical protein [Flavobacterium arcticum]AXG72926.1 hypothetical protein DVK85_01235 [Flavobacterium arcticum]KAF2510409.1 hypothetical protein E0W72_07970 [Flavobacterium arcticum]